MLRSTIAIAFFLLFGLSLSGQSDCRDFLVVCGNADLSLNSNGTGTDDFANANNQPPDCGFSESQSLWLKVPIARDGLLQFTISANNNQDDFDFAIYGPNVSCNNLGASIRCSSTNPQSAGVPADTGLRVTETENSEGPGSNGNGFVSALPVMAGEEYIILIDNFSQTNAGFTLDWGSNAPLIEVPSIDVADVAVCDPNSNELVPLDLSTLDDQIADGQTGVTVSYHNNEDDALLGENALNKRNFITSNNNQVLYARVTEDGSGCSSIGDFTIIINPDPVNDEIVGSQSICPTVGAVAYEGFGTNVDIYEWIVEGGVVASGQGTSDILVNWGGPNDEAMIKLVGKTNLGCISDTLFLPVKVNLELDPVLPQGDTEICYLDRPSVRYSVPQVTGSVYTWEVENGTVVGANGGNEVEVRWDDGATTGRVSYREYNPLITDCEGFSDTLEVQLLDEVLVEVTQVNPACNGETNGSIALGITGASGATSVVWADGVTGLIRNGLGDGDYAYTVTDEVGCQLQGMITLNEPDLLTITLEEAVSASCFESTDGGLVVSIAGGTESYRYQVNGENGVVMGSMLEVVNLGKGDYELIVRDENDCQARLGFSVTAPEMLEPDLESLQVRMACPGQADGEASVNALGGTPDYSFLWMPVNETGEQAANLAEGDYRVFITDANGCQTSLDVYVGELVPRVDIPNAFSPNADGVNDTFAPITNCQLTDYRLQIFNRWGNIIFFTDDQGVSWNGEVKNQPAPVGRYSYRLAFRVLVNDEVIEETYQGTLRVIR